MKERPILFSSPMVRALLDGSKTQTRRAIKIQPHIDSMGNFIWNEMNFGQEIGGEPCVRNFIKFHCPYGKIGDRLWVRETWAKAKSHTSSHIFYKADGDNQQGKQFALSYTERENKWRPSIHMFRDYSRINLEITAVRVERLNDISDADAKAEGVLQVESDGYQNYDGTGGYWGSAVNSFETLWESINGTGSWQANPWVWVVEFKRIGANE